jgi:hypothetical protein
MFDLYAQFLISVAFFTYIIMLFVLPPVPK